MTPLNAALQGLLAPIFEWMARGGDAWDLNLRYWRLRHGLRSEGEVFSGPEAPFLSAIDTAMDAFSPDTDRGPHQIDEVQLRAELSAALDGLRTAGCL